TLEEEARGAAVHDPHLEGGAEEDEPPEHMLDPLMHTLMRDPVTLPASGQVVMSEVPL
ncbi:hypothetical protein T484DRAFT_1777522, partial [Baffinella frigidus]